VADDREVRLEGVSLWIAGGVLAALVVGSFFVGRWTAPESAPGPGGAGPLDHVEEQAVDATDKLTFFDTLSGPAGKAEPGREARPGSAAPAPSAPGPLPATPGSWFVQVFAGRDPEAAQVVVRALGAKGWPVKVESQREGSGALYRVRVGGFTTREAADAAVQRLRGEGQSGAWVTKAGP
jgi:cell division protein FtsN